MKCLTLLFVSFLCLTSFIDSPVAQVIWTKDTLNNPVLSPGEPGEWDASTIQVDAVIFDDTTHHMWYTGGFSATPGIGYATSYDGTHWVKDTVNNPVFTVGEPGEWDDDIVASVSILSRDNVLHMWYTGGGNGQIGYATSPDGINWTRNPNNPVLSPGVPGSWDDQAVQQPVVLLDGDTLRMWYHGTQNFNNFNIGYATSVDGVVWAKNTSNPVLEVGSQGEWDSRWTISPFVIKRDEAFQMWYSGNDGQISHFGFATSPEGIHWTKDTLNNPVLSSGEPGEWDSDGIGSPTLLFNDPTYHMWYFGRYNNILSVGHAASLPSTIIRVPQDQPSIQAGIDAAADGNTVLVADGTYLENIDFKSKSITVASYYLVDGDTNHVANTVIDGSQPNNPDSGSVVYFVSGEDTNSILTGFTITGGSGTPVTARQETARGGGGILCLNSDARVTHNRIINNVVDDPTSLEAWGGGIYSWSDSLMSSIVIIEDNTIQQNTLNADTAALGGGVFVNSNARILNNLIAENVSATPGYCFGGGISARDYYEAGNSVEVTGNTVTYNQAVSSNYYGGQGAGLDMWYLDVTIGNNIISHNLSGGTGVCWGSAIMLGFAKEGSVVEDNIISNNSGVGDLSATFFLHECMGVTVQRNLLENNSAYWCGGIRNDFGGVNIIADNRIAENDAYLGGGIYLTSSSPVIQSNLIINNTANYGGGIQIFNPTMNANPKSKNGNLEANFADGGSLRDSRWCGNISRNTRSANSSGLAISRPVIINNTIGYNVASTRGGAIRTNDSYPVVINSILWGNEAPSNKQISLENGSIDVVYNDIQGGWPGDGNIDEDPSFADTINYQLSDPSPCIGAGADSIDIGGIWYHAPTTDIAGNPRPNPSGSMPDMGAWESPLPSPVVGILMTGRGSVPETYSLSQSYPNPFNPTTTIAYQVPRQSVVRIEIYNTLGQKVRTLLNKRKESGSYQAFWDGRNDGGAQMGSGVYLYRMIAGAFVQTRKMILMK